MEKQDIINALYTFAHKRPGLEPRNYISDWRDVEGRRAYNSESRAITRDLQDARVLLRALELRLGIAAEHILADSKHAFAGRLTINENATIDYCTGQYWPTEYRKAVCAIAARVLWSYWGRYLTTPEKIKKQARAEFGRGVASRWFN